MVIPYAGIRAGGRRQRRFLPLQRLLPFLLALCVPLLLAAPALAAAAEAPEVTVESPVPATTATFYGVLNPKATAPGEAGSYEFLYRQSKTECKGGSKAPSSPGMALGGAAEPVSETVTGLVPLTEYTVCLLARNAEGEAISPAVTFTTTGFGLERATVMESNQNGSPDLQAGSHPYSITTTFALHHFPYNDETLKQLPLGQGSLREVIARLPPGFVGDPNATPKCKYVEFLASECSPDTAIGIDTVLSAQSRCGTRGRIGNLRYPVTYL